MKLYIPSRIGNQKIWITSKAEYRNDLREQFNGNRFFCNGYEYYVSEVWAEPELIVFAGPTAVGGLIGALAGPIGIVVGLILGGGVGSKVTIDERVRAERFNCSR